MKRLFALSLALVMALSLAACGGQQDPGSRFRQHHQYRRCLQCPHFRKAR